MIELVNALISPWYIVPASVAPLVLTFVLLPGVLLHIAVLIYPKDDPRRREFPAELHTVPYIGRPFWVAGILVRCLFEGLPERVKAGQRRGYTRAQWTLRTISAVAVAVSIIVSTQWYDMIPAPAGGAV